MPSLLEAGFLCGCGSRMLPKQHLLRVSAGYSTCHWCHVMERESFESEEVAALM